MIRDPTTMSGPYYFIHSYWDKCGGENNVRLKQHITFRSQDLSHCVWDISFGQVYLINWKLSACVYVY